MANYFSNCTKCALRALGSSSSSSENLGTGFGSVVSIPDWVVSIQAKFPLSNVWFMFIPVHVLSPCLINSYNLLCIPPATTMVSPVTYSASWLTKNATAAAIFSGVPNRPKSVFDLLISSASLLATKAAANLVGTTPGAMQLTRMPSCPSSSARAFVRPNNAVFVTAYLYCKK
jgi:hypothetical protein